MRTVKVGDETHVFPDEATDQEISDALSASDNTMAETKLGRFGRTIQTATKPLWKPFLYTQYPTF